MPGLPAAKNSALDWGKEDAIQYRCAATGNLQVSYTYDAWGKPLTATGPMAATVGAINPLRYRGYVYDAETGLYYLQSRYYNPETGRFINADGYATTGQGFLGNNMFAYCLNSPLLFVDSSGSRPMIPPHVFQDDGIPEDNYIYDQDDPSVADMRFGVATVGHGGCGAVATYNALISLGVDAEFSDVLAYYNEYMGMRLSLNGLTGMAPSQIVIFFRKMGYRVLVTDNANKIDAYSKTADTSIMWYMYSRVYYPDTLFETKIPGAHFVQYSRTDTGYIGRNTSSTSGKEHFGYPSSYMLEGRRFYGIGIFIYK